MRVKIESFAMVAYPGTHKERVLFTFQVLNDDMNQCTIPDHWDIKELFNYLIDGDPVIARSYSVVETNEDSDTYNEIVNTARRVRLRLAQ